MAATELDLSQVDDIIKYLEGTPFSSTLVTPLVGGAGNYTFRLHLSAPYEGQRTLVFKHAKSHVAVAKHMKFALERQKFEVEALRRVKEILPADALVTVPVVHRFDSEMHTIIMDDCGETSRTLKQLILDEPLNDRMAQLIGKSIGQFLATVHQKCSASPELLQFFDEHQEGKTISAWVTYGRIMETVKDEGRSLDGSILIDPPLKLSLAQSDIDTLAKLTTEKAQAVISAKSAFVMGDFWSGNVLVDLIKDENGKTSVGRIFVVDWELAKPGLLGLDVGQFSAEMHLLRAFHPERKQSVDGVLSAFLDTYTRESQVDDETVKTAAIHVGAHLTCWTPRTPWGSAERTREVVVEGVDHLLKGYEGDPEWLKQSIVGELCR